MKLNTQTYRRLWRIYTPIAAFLTLALAYSFYWISLSTSLRHNIDDWIADQNEQGYVISYGALEISGYPFRLNINLTDVTVSQPGHPNDWTWHAARVVGVTLPYKLNHIILELRGPQNIDYEENLGPEARAPYRYTVTATAEAARSSLVFSKQKLERLSIDLHKLNADRQGPDGTKVLTAERLQIHTRPLIMEAGLSSPSTSSGLDLYIQAETLALPFENGIEAYPATPIDDIKINIHLADMDSSELNTSGIATWAEKGGKIDIGTSHLLWDQINITATGAFHLDAQSRLEGELSTLIGGYDQLVDLLVQSGTFDQNTGALLTSGLGLLAAFNGDNQGRIKTPVRIEQGEIFLGPAKIGNVGPLLSPYN